MLRIFIIAFFWSLSSTALLLAPEAEVFDLLDADGWDEDTEKFARDFESICKVVVSGDTGKPGYGSGVYIGVDKSSNLGVVLTAAHVVIGAKTVMLDFSADPVDAKTQIRAADYQIHVDYDHNQKGSLGPDLAKIYFELRPGFAVEPMAVGSTLPFFSKNKAVREPSVHREFVADAGDRFLVGGYGSFAISGADKEWRNSSKRRVAATKAVLRPQPFGSKIRGSDPVFEKVTRIDQITAENATNKTIPIDIRGGRGLFVEGIQYPGDSGGGLFYFNEKTWQYELVGIASRSWSKKVVNKKTGKVIQRRYYGRFWDSGLQTHYLVQTWTPLNDKGWVFAPKNKRHMKSRVLR